MEVDEIFNISSEEDGEDGEDGDDDDELYEFYEIESGSEHLADGSDMEDSLLEPLVSRTRTEHSNEPVNRMVATDQHSATIKMNTSTENRRILSHPPHCDEMSPIDSKAALAGLVYRQILPDTTSKCSPKI